MKPFACLAFLVAGAFAAPAQVAVAPIAAVAAAPAVAVHAAAPVAPAAAVAVPAPYTTQVQEAGVTTYHQPAAQVRKEVHYGQTSYISGYATRIHKPATPHLPIAVPTVLKGTQVVNAPVVKTVEQVHQVNEPVYVERRVEVPYDVPVYKEQIVEVPTPVHVDRPYAVPQPYPVAGEPIVRKTVTAPVVTHSHHTNVAVPAVAHAAYPVAAHAAVAAPAAAVAVAH